MKNTSIDDFGIYIIKNKINSRLYIGSTSDSFRKRWNLHKHHLENDKHRNSHLQYSWNKYGSDNFEFTIIEKCLNKLKVLEREQYYIDSYDFEDLYNINPLATGGLQFSEESIKKRTETNSKRNKILSERYKMWSSGLLSDENLNNVEVKMFEMWNTRVPWNKGIKYETTDHLKVPKKKKGNRSNDIETKRNNAPQIEVYSIEYELLGTFRSAKDLEEFSLGNECNLKFKSKFKSDFRKSTPSKMLRAPNINVACRTNKPYKGLIFKYKNTAPSVGDNSCEASKYGGC